MSPDPTDSLAGQESHGSGGNPEPAHERTHPQEPPVPLPADASLIRSRFSTRSVEVDSALLGRLESTGAAVTTAPACADLGRDWWPLALHWSTHGEVPALPAAAVRPSAIEQVAEIVQACNEARVPLTVSGGRSGVCGGSVPAYGGVMLDLTDLTGIYRVDAESGTVGVLPGTMGPDLENELRGTYGLTVGHWPQSMALATVGGWIACRGAGQYSTRYGKIEDIVSGLDVVLADGHSVHTAPSSPRAAMGPDLTQLFVGSEGTLGVIVGARLRAHPVPPAERRGAWGLPSFEAGLEVSRRILRRGATPAVLRLYDPVESARTFDVDDAAVLVVLDEADEHLLEATMSIVSEEAGRAGDELPVSLADRWYANRNDVSVLGPLVQAGIVVDTIEIAASWSALPTLYENALRDLMSLDGILAASAHESHAYSDGACLYFTFAGRPPDGAGSDSGKGVASEATLAWMESFYTKAWDAVMGATLACDGAISHHHGIGLNRARYLSRALGSGFGVLATLKSALDPQGILNPGKLALPSTFGEAPWP